MTGSLVALAITASITTAGVGFAYGSMPAVIMATTPPKDKAAANSFNSLMRSIGTAASAAVIGVILAQLSTTMGGHTIPTLAGIRVSLLIGSAVAIVAAVLAGFLPAHVAAPHVPEGELVAEAEAAALAIDGQYLPDEEVTSSTVAPAPA